MATIQEVRDDISALQATVTQIDVKIDQIAALVVSLRAGGGATPEELDQIRADLANVQNLCNVISSKEDVILAG